MEIFSQSAWFSLFFRGKEMARGEEPEHEVAVSS